MVLCSVIKQSSEFLYLFSLEIFCDCELCHTQDTVKLMELSPL